MSKEELLDYILVLLVISLGIMYTILICTKYTFKKDPLKFCSLLVLSIFLDIFAISVGFHYLEKTY